jgi:hypothetical protein
MIAINRNPKSGPISETSRIAFLFAYFSSGKNLENTKNHIKAPVSTWEKPKKNVFFDHQI